MANVWIEENTMSAIGNAIRYGTGQTDKILPSNMASEIKTIIDNHDALITGEISEYYNDRVTEIAACAFYSEAIVDKYTKKLCSVDFPNVTCVFYYAFKNCSSLTNINFPKLDFIYPHAFECCTSLTSIYLPKVWALQDYCFSTCVKLELVDLCESGNMYIQDYAFTKCDSLTAVILRSSTICKQLSDSAFDDTPIAEGTGYIYVPSDLLEDYQTTFTTYTNQFRAIEDYPDICGETTTE